ncbi:MAG: LysR family transcriptional regulator [Deltaproteobacteria bacterium]|nr:LysR family transcriptional regulator [Deltaproteobacteria bacterium]
MIETKQLQIFKTIVDVGSFTGAGEQLGISQSAISQHVRALEEELGVSLLVRLGRSTRMTPAGEVLLRCARQVLEKLDEARRFLDEHAHGRAGIVRIGTPEPPCNYLLPEVLVELKQRFPRIDARVTSGHTAMTLGRLAAGELDVALLPLPLDAGKLRVVEAGRDELVAVVPPDHPWTALPFVTARDFEKEPLLVYDRASQITDLTLGFLLEEGVFPRIAVEVDHLEALKDLAQRRLGVAVIPVWSARREIAGGALVPVRLGATGLTRAWGVLHPDLQPYPATLRALVRLFADALPALFAVGA